MTRRGATTHPPADTSGWPLPRHDAQNTGRSPLTGRMSSAPRERWQMRTGGDIAFARAVPAADGHGLLVLAGSVLQRLDALGRIRWNLGTLGVSAVQYVGDVDGTGAACALVKTDARTCELIDVASGERLWSFQAPPGTFVGDAAGFKVQPGPTGAALYLFPTYSTDAWCYDFSAGRRAPALRWHRRDLPFDAGFGPSVVLADMDGDGRPELFLSSRTGSEYRRSARAGRTTTAEIVLGRRNGEIWQAVMDPTTGEVGRQARFEAVPGAPHDSARPYGLLHAAALAPGALPEVVLVSCQVEEYAVLTRRTRKGGLARRDGWFVEKDWPQDHRELRPQPSSLADLGGDGRPLLVVGLWQDDRWRTLVLDPRDGLHDPVAVLEGRYFWGCHDVDGDGRPEIITTRESRRTPRAASTLEAWRGSDVRRVATLSRASIVASPNSPLPLDVAFMADRRNAIEVSLNDGRRGVLVRRAGTAHDGAAAAVGFWGTAAGGGTAFVPWLPGDFERADASGSEIVFWDASGELAQVNFDGVVGTARSWVEGRMATPLAWMPSPGRRELVVDLAGESITGGRPIEGRDGELADSWRVRGSLPALDVDASPPRLIAADSTDRDRPAVAFHPAPIGHGRPRRVHVGAPLYLGIVPVPGRRGYALNLRTGVHTMSVELRDHGGRLRWADPDKGAYLRPPAVDIVAGGAIVLSDDHGELRRYGPDGEIAWMADWTAAYTQPMPGPYGPDGEWAILRGGGIHGLELLDANGASIWRVDADLWEYASSTPAIGWLGNPRDPGGRAEPALGAMTRGGRFHCVDVRTGRLRWESDMACAPNATSIVAADVDGDGADEFLVGLPDGRLVCLGEDGRDRGAIRWSMQFEAAVGNPIVVDLDGDGRAELVVATADGAVRWLA